MITLDFDTIYRQYYRPIRIFCYKIVGNIEQAEDLTQATFISFWQAMPELMTRERLYVSPYLYQIARNKCRDFLRHLSCIEWCSLEEEHTYTGDFAERLEEQEIIRKAMDTLSAYHREALSTWVLGRRVPGPVPARLKMASSRAREAFRIAYAQETGQAS